MPTQVRPDDPTATGAARLQSMVGGARTPGSPSMAGKPDVQAGRTSFPAPPTPATAPPGRQPDGARAAMTSPGTPAAGVAPTSATPPQAVAPSSQPPGTSQPAPAAGSSQTAGVGAPAAPAPPTVDANGQVTQTLASPTIPKPGAIMPGSSVQTPFGTVSTGPAGQRLALDANGQQKFKESMAALRGRSWR